jgi:hypothetical protein
MKRLLIAVVFVLSLPYVADYSVLRYRIARNSAFGTVTIKPYYAVPLKGNKTEFIFIPPETQSCIHSLFPHLGYSPCWYLSRQTRKRIDM